MIKIQEVSKIYHGKQGTVEAVKDVSLDIKKGEIFGIIGFSGAGKSTLIRLLNGLESVTTGHIFVNDKDITTLKKKELLQERRKIAMIFQHFNLLWSRTVEENIAFSLEIAGVAKDVRQKKVAELIEIVGLTGREKSYPSQLSGGQKQRVGIARALANDPEVLLCDEATSALDPKTTESILELLKKVNEQLGITIVIITHEMQVVKEICNKVAVMEQGLIIEQGSVLEIFTNPQKPLTKDFIDTATHINKGIETVLQHEHLLNLNPGDVLAKISFVGASTGEPLITKLSTQFQVAANILFANVEVIQETAVGTLLVGLSGEAEKIQQAIEYIHQSGVQTEILDEPKEVE